MKKLFTGNEAVARGAYEAGVKFASAYPGTPSTEILENIATYKEAIVAEWAPNEKVALEAAIGGSIAGARTMASMKHVGVNVAADPLFTFATLEINGGMVLVTADEPGMHSSQNEQDNRNYAKFAKIAMLEPSDSQESKDMVKAAYEISEKFDTMVLFRMTTRVCHSKSIVECYDREEVGVKPYVKNVKKLMTVPAHARVFRHNVEERLKKLEKFSNETELNYFEWNDTKIGIIASGMSFNFAKEVFGKDVSYLKLGFTNPLPMEKIKEFATKVDKIYIVEENDPFIEDQVKAAGIACEGTEVLPYSGEMTPDVIRKSFFGETLPRIEYSEEKISIRPPTFCTGCPHRGFFYELGKKKNVVVAGDIGCYGLAFAQPYNALDYNICMGASLSSAHGAQKVFNMNPDNKTKVIGVLGDSTFFHTGMNSLIENVYNNSTSVSVILDNRVTAMTGHQENPGSGYTAQGQPTKIVEIEPVVRALGVEHVRTVDPNDLKAVNEALDWALDLDSPSVIITRYPCALKKFSKEDYNEFGELFAGKCVIDSETCIGCKSCMKTGCPALSYDNQLKKASIDPMQCVGCEVCVQVCPVKAIAKEVK